MSQPLTSPTTSHPDKSGRWLLVLLVLFAAIWLVTLGTRKLLNPDEGRYAEIPREMVASGDWLTPRLNDLKYFEKPPLQYWATAAAYEIFGQNEFASRFWCGITGLAGIFFAGFLGKKLFSTQAGLLAASLLSGSLMYVILGHINTLDMSLSFFLLIAIGAFLLAQQAPQRSAVERNWMLVAWAAVALGFLTKGLEVVVLPGLTFIAYTLIEREYSAWKRLHVLAGLAVLIAIAAPWVIAMSIVNPEFPHFFFIHEHFERFTTDVHQRVEPWWFFIPLLIVGALPWTTIALGTLSASWNADKAAKDSIAGSPFHFRRFLILWFLVVMLFFSASHSKLAPYILPVMPALAILCGDAVSRMKTTILRRHIVAIALVWIAAIGYLFFGPLPAKEGVPPAIYEEMFVWGRISFAIMLLVAIASWWLASRERVTHAMLALGLGTLFGLSVLLYGFDTARQVSSGYDLAEQIRPHQSNQKPFYNLDDYDQTIPFYLKRAVTLVSYRNELDFGLTQEPNKGLPDHDAFKAAWGKDPSGSIALMPRATFDLFKAEHLPMAQIGQNLQLIAVIKP